MTSTTLGWLAGRGTRVHITCGNSRCDHMSANHYGLTLGADEAAQRWGAEMTLEQVRARARCTICAKRMAHIDVSTPSAKMGAGP